MFETDFNSILSNICHHLLHQCLLSKVNFNIMVMVVLIEDGSFIGGLLFEFVQELLCLCNIQSLQSKSIRSSPALLVLTTHESSPPSGTQGEKENQKLNNFNNILNIDGVPSATAFGSSYAGSGGFLFLLSVGQAWPSARPFPSRFRPSPSSRHPHSTAFYQTRSRYLSSWCTTPAWLVFGLRRVCRDNFYRKE